MLKDFDHIIYFLSIILCHLLVTFHLQDPLNPMKSKEWWKRQCKNEEEFKKYNLNYNHKVFLSVYSLEWSIIIHIPIIILIYTTNIEIGWLFLLSIFINYRLHRYYNNLDNTFYSLFGSNFCSILQCIIIGIIWWPIIN